MPVLTPLEPTAADPLGAAFAALSDPTRRAILSRLALGEAHVGELLLPLGMSGAALSRHLRVLEQAQLIERQVHAQRRVCRLRPEGLQVAADWLAPYRAFWEASLDRLAEAVEAPAPSPPQSPSPPPLPAPSPTPTPTTTPTRATGQVRPRANRRTS